MKKCCREDGEYEQQGTKNKKLRMSGLLIRCSNCGHQGHNKKPCYKQTKFDTHAGPSTGPTIRPFSVNSTGLSTAQSASVQSIRPTPTATQTSDGPPPTVGPSNTAKKPSTKGRGQAKLPIRRSQK